MLLDLNELIKEFDLKITGVVHVGMHEMEELKIYNRLGIYNIIWFEADEELCNKYRSNTNGIIVNAVISDKQELVDFNVMNKKSSNSILEPYMNIKYRTDIKLLRKEKRLTTPLKLYNLGYKYNFLNLDIQGAELKALKGADLRYIDYIYTEVNIQEMYKDIPRIDDIDRYLKNYTRVATKIHKNKFGDALYVKKHN